MAMRTYLVVMLAMAFALLLDTAFAQNWSGATGIANAYEGTTVSGGTFGVNGVAPAATFPIQITGQEGIMVGCSGSPYLCPETSPSTIS